MRPEYQGLDVSVNTVMPTPYAITFQLERGHHVLCTFVHGERDAGADVPAVLTRHRHATADAVPAWRSMAQIRSAHSNFGQTLYAQQASTHGRQSELFSLPALRCTELFLPRENESLPMPVAQKHLTHRS